MLNASRSICRVLVTAVSAKAVYNVLPGLEVRVLRSADAGEEFQNDACHDPCPERLSSAHVALFQNTWLLDAAHDLRAPVSRLCNACCFIASDASLCWDACQPGFGA